MRVMLILALGKKSRNKLLLDTDPIEEELLVSSSLKTFHFL
jgi:hypothetical protein